MGGGKRESVRWQDLGMEIVRGSEEALCFSVSINVRVGKCVQGRREAGVQEEPHITGNSPVLRAHKSPFPTLPVVTHLLLFWPSCLSVAVR